MKKTTNYEFTKIDLFDSPPDITVLNSNWDSIDNLISTKADIRHNHDGVYLAAEHGSDNTVHCNEEEKAILASGGNVRSSTVIVGLEGEHNKHEVDILASASDSTSALQEAISRVSVSGGSVYLLEGTYTIFEPLNIYSGNVKLCGMGNGTVLTSDIVDGKSTVVLAGRNSSISDLQFISETGNFLTISGVRNTVKDVVVYTACNGIEVTSTASHTLITGCTLCNLETGFNLNGKYCRLLGNSASDCTKGVNAGGSYNLVADNTFANCSAGVYVTGQRDSISNNVIMSGSGTAESYGEGEYTITIDGAADYTLVGGNILAGCDVRDSGSNTLVYGNSI